MIKQRVNSGLVVVSLLLCVQPLGAGVTFNRLIGVGDAAPGNPGSSMAAVYDPVLHQGVVTFWGRASAYDEIYATVGGNLSKRFDERIQVPQLDPPDSFSQLLTVPKYDNGKIYFAGLRGLGPPRNGIYTYDLGTNLASRIVDNTQLPISTIDPFDVHNGTVAVALSGSLGAYVISGASTPVPIPNSINARQVAAGSGKVAFTTMTNNVMDSVRLYDGASTQIVADTSTAVPNHSGAFRQFSDISLAGDDLYFMGHYSGGAGIFRYAGNQLTSVLDLPANSTGLSTDGSSFAWLQYLYVNDYPTYAALYLHQGGATSMLADTDHAFDGAGISWIRLTSDSLEGHQLAFQVVQDSGAYVTYIGSLPEPGSMVITMVGGLIWLAKRRRGHFSRAAF